MTSVQIQGQLWKMANEWLTVKQLHVLGLEISWLVSWLVFNSTFNTDTLYRATGVWYILCTAGDKRQTHNKTMKQHNKLKSEALFSLGFVEMTFLPLAW